MRRTPPDILITTPESLYLMITSQVREILTGVEAVIVDEIHAVAQSKRGSHLALTLERLSHLVAERGQPRAAADRALGDPAPAGADRRVPGRAEARVRDRQRRGPQGPRPRDRRPRRRHDGARRGLLGSARPAGERRGAARGFARPHRPRPDRGLARPGRQPALDLAGDLPGAAEAGPRAHLDDHLRQQPPRRRTPRQAPQRAPQRGSEPELPATEHAGDSEHESSAGDAARQDPHAANSGPAGGGEFEEIARAHHGSLAHEERLVVEELLKSGKLPCLVATSSLELGIDMGALDLVIQVESPKSVSRGLQRVGRAGHQLNEVSKGRIFPKFRADLLECAVVAKRMREGEIEETVIPRNPLDVLAQHLVSMVADDEWQVDEVERVVTAGEPFSELSREQLENVLDMLDGRYPSEKFAELRPRLVWDRTAGTVRGPQGRPPARGHQRRHDPRPRPLRRPPARRAPGRRARRGDGLRGAPGPDLPARRDHLADPGHHPRPGDRHPGARRARGGAVLARRRGRAPVGARPRDRRLRPRGGRRRTPRRSPPRTTSTRARPRTWSPTCASSRPRPGSCPPTRRWSSRSFRDEIGDWRLCVLSPVRRPRPRRLGAGALGTDPRRARPRGGRDLVRRRDRRPPARRRRAARRRPGPARARRDRGPGRARARRLGPVRRPLSRERRPQPADPARLPGQAHAALAAAAASRRACSRSPRTSRASR